MAVKDFDNVDKSKLETELLIDKQMTRTINHMKQKGALITTIKLPNKAYFKNLNRVKQNIPYKNKVYEERNIKLP